MKNEPTNLVELRRDDEVAFADAGCIEAMLKKGWKIAGAEPASAPRFESQEIQAAPPLAKRGKKGSDG